MREELVRFDGSPVFESDIREDNLQNLYWRAKEEGLIAVPNLENKHLRNIALMLMGFGYQKSGLPDRMKVLWLTALRMEWERRIPTFGWALEDGILVNTNTRKKMVKR